MCEISILSLSPQHHHRSGLQSWLHTQPNMPHLLFSHHTHCSPTPSPIIMPLSIPHPCVRLPRAGVAHMHAAAGPASQGIGSRPGLRGCSTAGVLQSVTRFCSAASSVSQICPEPSRRSSANIYAPTHALTPNQYVFKYSHTPPHIVAR